MENKANIIKALREKLSKEKEDQFLDKKLLELEQVLSQVKIKQSEVALEQERLKFMQGQMMSAKEIAIKDIQIEGSKFLNECHKLYKEQESLSQYTIMKINEGVKEIDRHIQMGKYELNGIISNFKEWCGGFKYEMLQIRDEAKEWARTSKQYAEASKQYAEESKGWATESKGWAMESKAYTEQNKRNMKMFWNDMMGQNESHLNALRNVGDRILDNFEHVYERKIDDFNINFHEKKSALDNKKHVIDNRLLEREKQDLLQDMRNLKSEHRNQLSLVKRANVDYDDYLQEEQQRVKAEEEWKRNVQSEYESDMSEYRNQGSPDWMRRKLEGKWGDYINQGIIDI